MCGRFTLNQSVTALANAFHLQPIPDLAAQYNIAPTQMVLTVLNEPTSNKHEFQRLRWGLIPSWAEDVKMGVKLINARAETIAEKPAFRAAFKRRRCLVLADGFYEWEKQQSKKQPFYFRLQDGQPFGFAGLWDIWQPAIGEQIASCTIVTTTANELLQPICDRMPVIVAPEDYDLWLNTQVQTPEKLQPLLRPYPAQEMTSYPVSTKVNKPQYNSPQCIIPLPEENALPNQLN